MLISKNMEKYDYIEESNASYSNQYLKLPSNSPSDQFEVLNPLQFPSLSRCDSNVLSRRNFIFEMDKEPLSSQVQYVKKLNNVINRWVFSGSKSIHMRITISHNPQSVEEYKYIWDFLNEKYFDEKADRACSNPARLTRKLGGYRADKGKIQVGKNLNSNILDVSFLQKEFNVKKAEWQNTNALISAMQDNEFHGKLADTISETLDNLKNHDSENWKCAKAFVDGNASYEEGLKALSYLKWLGFSYWQIKQECNFGKWNFRESLFDKINA